MDVFFTDEDRLAYLDMMRERTRTGRPLGSPTFVERIEGVLGRVLRLGKPGRKPVAEARKKMW